MKSISFTFEDERHSATLANTSRFVKAIKTIIYKQTAPAIRRTFLRILDIDITENFCIRI